MSAVTVFRTFNSAEAQIARSRLEAAGFHPFVAHELSSLSIEGYSMAAGGIEVQVPETESEEARAFLIHDEEPPPSTSDPDTPEPPETRNTEV